MGPSSPSTEGPSPAAAAAMGSSSNSSNSSSSSSSSNSIPPLLHALVGWSTLWQFPPPPSVPRALALSTTRELAAVLALLQSAPAPAAASAAAAAAAAALPRLLQLAEGGPFKKEIEHFLAALQIRIQASFDKAVGELCMETLHALPAATAAAATAAADATPAAAAPAAADATAAAPAAECEGPQLGQQLPSVEAFEERLSLERRLKNLKTAAENSRKNTQSHKPLVQRLKAELECLDSALKQVLEREEALKQGMPFAACSS